MMTVLIVANADERCVPVWSVSPPPDEMGVLSLFQLQERGAAGLSNLISTRPTAALSLRSQLRGETSLKLSHKETEAELSLNVLGFCF